MGHEGPNAGVYVTRTPLIHERFYSLLEFRARQLRVVALLQTPWIATMRMLAGVYRDS